MSGRMEADNFVGCGRVDVDLVMGDVILIPICFLCVSEGVVKLEIVVWMM